MSAFTISVATENEVREIQLGRRLRHFNYTIVGEYPEGQAISLNAKDEAGNLLGGFRGEVFFGWLLINVLFVERSERVKGSVGAFWLTAKTPLGRKGLSTPAWTLLNGKHQAS